MKLNLPSVATLVLSLAAGVLTVLVNKTFGLDREWISGLSVALTFLAGIGIGPLTGDQFVAALHLPPNVLITVTAAMAAATLAATTIHNSTTAAVVSGVLTFLSALGFGARVTLAKAQAIVRSGS